jgi:hypothetical protein
MANPKFTQKHFRAIAQALAERAKDEKEAGVPIDLAGLPADFAEPVDALCCLFEESNPKFDRHLFLAVIAGEKSVNSLPARKSTIDDGTVCRFCGKCRDQHHTPKLYCQGFEADTHAGFQSTKFSPANLCPQGNEKA